VGSCARSAQKLSNLAGVRITSMRPTVFPMFSTACGVPRGMKICDPTGAGIVRPSRMNWNSPSRM
jgi:hypothetical protein